MHWAGIAVSDFDPTSWGCIPFLVYFSPPNWSYIIDFWWIASWLWFWMDFVSHIRRWVPGCALMSHIIATILCVLHYGRDHRSEGRNRSLGNRVSRTINRMVVCRKGKEGNEICVCVPASLRSSPDIRLGNTTILHFYVHSFICS